VRRGRNMGPILSLAAAGVLAGTARAQSTPSQPRFEVASVKPSPSGEKFGSMSGGPLPAGPFNAKTGDPTRIIWTNVRLMRVLMMAYDLPPDQISGPGWLGSEMYDIVATMPEGTTVADFKLMVQSLLAERFKMTVHREVKEVSGYWLEVAPGGLKIKESTKDRESERAGASARRSDSAITVPAGVFVDQSGFPAPLPKNPAFPPGAGFSATINVNGIYRATVLNQSMPSIVKFLTAAAGMPVEDHTGLKGTYDFHLEYKPNLPETAAATPADIAAPGPDLLDAVQSQLGLKLKRMKAARELLVIDHAEKAPSEN
jgi:uncharacterized protein (TIGR03435 family)